MIKLDLQITVKNNQLPTKSDFKKWLTCTFKELPIPFSNNIEICIRIVDQSEIKRLNTLYRKKPHPTNILSFPYEIDDDPDEIPLLGDLVICADIIEQEAAEQNIALMAHWAHIVIHGALHLLGYDHITDKDCKEMEDLENKILKTLGFSQHSDQ